MRDQVNCKCREKKNLQLQRHEKTISFHILYLVDENQRNKFGRQLFQAEYYFKENKNQSPKQTFRGIFGIENVVHYNEFIRYVLLISTTNTYRIETST